MSRIYYSVQFDFNSSPVICDNLKKVFDLLLKEELISICRYNDHFTGKEYAKFAAQHNLIIPEQKQKPFFILSSMSEDGTFVNGVDFWIENYLEEEFYNPEQMPYVEKIIGDVYEDS